MNGKRVSIDEELRAIDRREARREPKLHRCDHCVERGVNFFNGNWLCAACLRRMRERLEVTR